MAVLYLTVYPVILFICFIIGAGSFLSLLFHLWVVTSTDFRAVIRADDSITDKKAHSAKYAKKMVLYFILTVVLIFVLTYVKYWIQFG